MFVCFVSVTVHISKLNSPRIVFNELKFCAGTKHNHIIRCVFVGFIDWLGIGVVSHLKCARYDDKYRMKALRAPPCSLCDEQPTISHKKSAC